MGRFNFAIMAAVLALTGCMRGQPRGVEGGVLGRVVIYRNGVAFYERRAMVVDGQLTVRVPRERVDDFLKSLTVVDPSTRKPLSVTIPRQQAEDGSYLTMTLETTNRARTEVLLTYVTAAPAWKPSYRVVLGTDQKVMLEGWAIVDNTTSEDWQGVLIGVGSSSALAFRYDLWSVRQIDRDLLAGDDRLAIAPPDGVSPYSTAGMGNAVELGTLGSDEVRTTTGVVIEAEYTKNIPVPGRTFGSVLGAAPGVQADGVTLSGSSHAESVYLVEGINSTGLTTGAVTSAPEPPPPVREGDEKLTAIAKQVLASRKDALVEVFDVATAAQAAAARGTAVKHALVDAGVPAARIRVTTTLGTGAPPGVKILAIAPSVAPARELGPDVPVGESHFFADRPMTVRADTSAMVSMLRSETTGGVAYLYDPISERGDARYAFKAVRIVNPTGDTLEPGPITVYGDGRFIGEGVTEPVPPHAAIVVPFALDKQIIVERDETDSERIAQLVTLQRGVLTAELQHRRQTRFRVTSRLAEGTTVYLRHRLAAGWTLVDAPTESLSVGDSQLFSIELAAGETQAVTIAETTPVARTFELASEATLGMMQVFIDEPEASPVLAAAVRAMLASHRTVADLEDRIATLREQLGELRSRAMELNTQLVTLKAVRTGGPLMATLRSKLGEMATRSQRTTIALVDAQERQMLARVELQNQLAELRLPDAAASASYGISNSTK